MQNLPALLQQAGATAGAVVVLLGLAWRVARPHVRTFVAEVRGTAATVDRELTPDSGQSVKDHAKRAATAAESLTRRVAEVERLLELVSSRAGDLERALEVHLDDATTGTGRLRDLERVVDDTLAELRRELTIYRALLAGAGLAASTTVPGGRRADDHAREEMESAQ